MPAVRLDEQLDGADAVRPVAPGDRGRDAGPAQDLAELVGRHLPAVQGARRKVPQRRLAARRLVDDVQPGRRMRLEAGQEGVVRGAAQDAEELHLGELEEKLFGLRRW